MKKIRYSDSDFELAIQPLLHRSAFDAEIDKGVAKILADVKADGDDALVRYAAAFDHVQLTPADFRVSAEEIAAARASIDDATREAITTAVTNIRAFSSQRLPQNWEFSPRDGVVLGERFHALDRIACYVPGGTAPLLSTVCHTVTIAKTAGVKEVCVITPCGKDGHVNPAVLAACDYAGATEVYKLGGVYGVAAMAYGTQTIRKVEKIVGPGNAYVTSAKRQLYGEIALDLVAGPSEVMVLSDSRSNPAFIAADLLAQAEHGSGREQAVLVSTDAAMLDKVEAELQRQSALLTRSECIAKVLANGVFLIQAKDVKQMQSLASMYAPEHLEIMTENPEDVAAGITAAGAMFLGDWTPEPVGDFVAGPSHVLPTGGAGRYFSGLTVDMFFRRSSIVKYGQAALMKELPHIETFARCEGLDGHGNSATIRKTGK